MLRIMRTLLALWVAMVLSLGTAHAADGPRKVIIDDEEANSVAEAIVKSANTGKIGDGKVFISNVEEAIRIRTGETGAEAVAVN